LVTRTRRMMLANPMFTAAALCGVMQVLIAHWAFVVLGAAAGPGAFVWLLLTVLMVAANVAIVPFLRTARRDPGLPGIVARGYTIVGISTLLMGLMVALAWAGAFPLLSIIGWLGLGADLAFDVFRVVSALGVFALAFMLVWGFTGGQKHVERTRVRVELEGLAESHRGLRIVQISDLHIGNGLEGERLDEMVASVNALDPDIVALTGDLFDFDPAFVEDGSKRLGGLRARHGVFAVLGNHDTYTGAEEVADALARNAPSLKLLRDEVVRLPLAEPLYLAGVDDPGRGWNSETLELEELERIGGELPDDGPVMLLVHRPQAFLQAARLGFPLVLAGHTHGGQLALPTPGGRINLARIMTRFHRGLYRERDSLMYVNRGIGVAGPAIRFNCSREIATIELA
jgi:predicted MPP superfamily phosphohydrolase